MTLIEMEMTPTSDISTKQRIRYVEVQNTVYQRIQSETVGAKCFWWAYKILEEVLRTEGTVAWLLSQRKTTPGATERIKYSTHKTRTQWRFKASLCQSQDKSTSYLVSNDNNERWPDFTELDEESRASFVWCANSTSKMHHNYMKSNLASRSVRLTMLILGHVLDMISPSTYKYIFNCWSFKIIRQAFTMIVFPNDWFVDWWIYKHIV